MKIIQSTIPFPIHHYTFAQPIEQIAFFDIETTGLSPKASSLYLIGAMHYDTRQEQWCLTQWFADDYHSEKEILTSFFEYLKPFHALYHFNGVTFDIPYVTTKCQKHQLAVPEYARQLFRNTVHHQTVPGQERISVDLLKEIRPLKKTLRLVKANQTALEHWLGVNREDTYHGGELISVYTEYMQSKILHPEDASSLEKLLLLHNHDDIAGMLEVCSFLSYRDCLSLQKPPVIQSCSQKTDSITIQFTLPQPVPRPVQISHLWDINSSAISEQPAVLSLTETVGKLTLPVIQDTLKYFFEQYRDYFYLPEEDHAIHKSVAQFVDPAFRKKATAATCYTKKEGCFMPSCSKKGTAWDEPLLYSDYKSKQGFYEVHNQDNDTLAKQLSHYLFYELPYFL